MSKSTPLEQLPKMSNDNVQVNLNGGQNNPMQQPPTWQPSIDGSGGQALPDSEFQRMDMQDNYMKRQFIPQTNMNVPMNNDYVEPPMNQNQHYNQPQLQAQPQPQPQPQKVQLVKNTETSNNVYTLVKENSKMLAVLFALFMAVQTDIVQFFVRSIVRMTKVPENMLFTVSKVLTSVVGVILFFISYRNL